MWGENNVLFCELTVGNDGTFHYWDFCKMANKILVLVKVKVAFKNTASISPSWTNHPEGKWHVIQYGMVLVPLTSWEWKSRGAYKSYSEHCLKPFQTPWKYNIVIGQSWHSKSWERAKYDVAS